MALVLDPNSAGIVKGDGAAVLISNPAQTSAVKELTQKFLDQNKELVEVVLNAIAPGGEDFDFEFEIGPDAAHIAYKDKKTNKLQRVKIEGAVLQNDEISPLVEKVKEVAISPPSPFPTNSMGLRRWILIFAMSLAMGLSVGLGTHSIVLGVFSGLGDALVNYFALKLYLKFLQIEPREALNQALLNFVKTHETTNGGQIAFFADILAQGLNKANRHLLKLIFIGKIKSCYNTDTSNYVRKKEIPTNLLDSYLDKSLTR